MKIIITGGGVGNKGAQSMLFITVAAMKKKFPHDDIVLLTLGKTDDSPYCFSMKHVSFYAIKMSSKGNNLLARLIHRVSKDQLKAISDLYQDARLQIDISGYALGSNWPYATVDYYLSCIQCARRYNVPVYVLPQSFGPFEGTMDHKLMKRIYSTMTYPKVVYAREQEGFALLREKFGLVNVIQSVDMVLRCKSVNPLSIYNENYKAFIPDVLSNSVAVIPNKRNYIVGSSEISQTYYHAAIDQVLRSGKYVYILYHSKEDEQICRNIKCYYAEDQRVIFLDHDFSCFEYEALVCNFDYIIASRYHSIVHALKNGVPCIAIGWATKYNDLLMLFSMHDGVFDVREQLDCQRLKATINRMNLKFVEYRNRILEVLASIQQIDLFDSIG